jgi:GT2 family glycosyltransferase
VTIPPRVGALVLTHRRPRLATDVVRGLVDKEGFAPRDVLLVVNGEGGLDDPALEQRISMLRLAENLGPAGGYAAGLRHAAERADLDWLYICEDDVGLFELPTPRIRSLLERLEAEGPEGRVGAVAAYARDLNPRTGITLPHAPGARAFEVVDVAAWGATLLSMEVVRAGVLPDPELFFGYEDFDFWLRMRAAGFTLLLDTQTARAVHEHVLEGGRQAAHAGKRPVDAEEAWRCYYEARNFLILARRFGGAGWVGMHAVKSVRRIQLAASGAHRSATLHGLWDGLRGQTGKNSAYLRARGEVE